MKSVFMLCCLLSVVLYSAEDILTAEVPVGFYGYRIGQYIRLSPKDYDAQEKTWRKGLPVRGDKSVDLVLATTTAEGEILELYTHYEGVGTLERFDSLVKKTKLLLHIDPQIKTNGFDDAEIKVTTRSVKFHYLGVELWYYLKIKEYRRDAGKRKEKLSLHIRREYVKEGTD